jgi:hypothetical protein
MLTEGIANNTMHKIYAVDILPNAMVEQALFTEDYSTPEITENFIKLETVVDVNVLFDKSVLPQAIDSKENFTDVVITNFFISDSGKIGNKTHGEISGTFYGSIKPLKALKVDNKIIIESQPHTANLYIAFTSIMANAWMLFQIFTIARFAYVTFIYVEALQ